MNLPIGAFAAICLAFCLRLPKKKLEPAPLWTQLLRLDPLGTFFFIPSVVALLLALEWGGSKYQWSDPRIIGVLSAFGALWVAFCASQYLNPKNATVPKRIIGQRSILMGAIFMFCLSGSMMMMMYFLPLWCKFALRQKTSFVCKLLLISEYSPGCARRKCHEIWNIHPAACDQHGDWQRPQWHCKSLPGARLSRKLL